MNVKNTISELSKAIQCLEWVDIAAEMKEEAVAHGAAHEFFDHMIENNLNKAAQHIENCIKPAISNAVELGTIVIDNTGKATAI